MPVKIGVLIKEIFKAGRNLLKDLTGAEFSLEHTNGPQGTREDIQEILLPEAFVTEVKVDNIAEEDFWILVEKRGAIYLAGKMLLLPQKSIEESIKKGEVNEAIEDAQREIFNMLVGIIDDLFRQRVDSSWHLTQGNTFLLETEEFLPPKEYSTFIGEISTEDNLKFKLTLIFSQDLIRKIEGEEEKIEEEKQVQTEEVVSQKVIEETPPPPEYDIFQELVLKDSHGLTAEDIAEKDFPAIYPEATLEEALEKMRANKTEYLFVVDGLKLLGVITMKDVRMGLSPFLEEPFREYARPQDEATKKFKVSWFMETEVLWVPPEASVLEVAKTAARRPMFSIPVCLRGRIIGEIPITKLIIVLAKLAFSAEENAALKAEQTQEGIAQQTPM